MLFLVESVSSASFLVTSRVGFSEKEINGFFLTMCKTATLQAMQRPTTTGDAAEQKKTRFISVDSTELTTRLVQAMSVMYRHKSN